MHGWAQEDHVRSTTATLVPQIKVRGNADLHALDILTTTLTAARAMTFVQDSPLKASKKSPEGLETLTAIQLEASESESLYTENFLFISM